MKTVTRCSVVLHSSVDDASYFLELQFVPRDPCKREVTDMGLIYSNVVTIKLHNKSWAAFDYQMRLIRSNVVMSGDPFKREVSDMGLISSNVVDIKSWAAFDCQMRLIPSNVVIIRWSL